MKKQRRRELSNLCKQHQVHALYTFGSRSKEVLAWVGGDTAELSQGISDVDIGIKTGFDQKWDVKQKVLFAIALEDFFDCSRVDLVVLEDADPFLAAEIIKGERLFARDEYEADEFDLFVLRRAGDLIPLKRERLNLILRGGE